MGATVAGHRGAPGGAAALSAGRAAPRAVGRASWLWLITGWLPLVALFATLILTSHPHTTAGEALGVALRMIVAAALLGLLVDRLAGRVPWPHPFRLWFLGVHLLVAPVYAVVFLLLNSVIESILHRRLVLVLGPGLVPYLVAAVWLYLDRKSVV